MLRRKRNDTRLAFEGLEVRQVLSANAIEHAGIAHFLDTSDVGFERYDVQAEAWIERVDLQEAFSPLTVGHVDADGYYLAFGKAVYRYASDGSGQQHLLNTAEDVDRIFSDGNLLLLIQIDGTLVTIDKTTNATVDEGGWQFSRDVSGVSHDPERNRLYGRTSGISPSDIMYLSYTDNGTINGSDDSPYHNDYPNAAKTFVFGDSGRVVDSSGTMYSSLLEWAATLPPTITDIDFLGGRIPIVLSGNTSSGNTLTAYTQGLLPTGSSSLMSSATSISVNDESVIAFSVDASQANGWNAEVVPLTQLSAPDPNAPFDPNGVTFEPDEIALADDGTVLFFSSQHQHIFRFDPTTQAWIPSESIPTSGAAKYSAYSDANNAAYLAYDTGQIQVIDFDDAVPTELPFTTLSESSGLATAGDVVLAVDASLSLESHQSFSADGTQLSAVRWIYHSSEYVWSEPNQRFYYISEGVSPSDLMYGNVFQDGTLGGRGDSPFHGNISIRKPVRVAPDGSVVVLGSGIIFDSTTLDKLPQSLTNTIADIAWLGDTAYSIRELNGLTELQSWTTATYGQTGVAQLFGTPHAIKAISSEHLMVVTLRGGVPDVTIIDAAMNVLNPPTAMAGQDTAVNLGSSAVLDGSESFDPDGDSLEYTWTLLSGPDEAATFSSADSIQTEFAASQLGVYQIELKVSDGQFEGTDVIELTYREPVGEEIVGRTSDGEWWAAVSDGTRFTNEYVAEWATNTGWHDVQLADVNGDGLNDLIGRNDAGEVYVSLADEGGQQTFQKWGNLSPLVTWEDVNAADVNGDGKSDLVGRANGQWWVAVSQGSFFTIEFWGRWSNGVQWEDVRVGDYNGDGREDIAGRTNGNWWLARSTGQVFVTEHWGRWSNAVTWDDVLVADFDGDGRDDIAGRTSGDWWLSRSTGNDHFVTEFWGRWSNSVDWNDVLSGDFDGDGRADIAGRTSGDWWLARSSANDYFTTEFWGRWADVAWTDVSKGDFNGDGADDIAGRFGNDWWLQKSDASKFQSEHWGAWGATDWLDVKVGHHRGPRS